MRLIMQRVDQAEVKNEGKIVGKIKRGLFVLLGVSKGDKEEDALFLAEKLAKLRVMSDEKGKINLAVKDVEGKVLVVSQFTLYADTKGGNRPSFIKAAEPELALKLYNLFIEKLKNLGIEVETGKFGSYMKISLELDGPVTIILDSNEN
ncbi:MAG: D-tyrosyl-tRNA(Tyr) deacylase (EC 3.6.1.n1) [Candidatus Woesebacteria bacterium]|nr:MAG: D-tyrosyl-tRNA(Tyr) deacylase (EC 3.6.1.n1) [Candidatus Woesebacteria bacterium]